MDPNQRPENSHEPLNLTLDLEYAHVSCHCLLHFPPPARLALHEAVLNEILEERVVSSRSGGCRAG